MLDEEEVKVLLREDAHVETVWAVRVGPDLYRLENSPFWAYGVSWKDTVVARQTPDGMLEMLRVATKSGHRTLRVFFESPLAVQERIDAVLADIHALGATYEGMNRRYVAIDLAPGVSMRAVSTYLTQEGVKWEHADPPYEAVAPEDRPGPG